MSINFFQNEIWGIMWPESASFSYSTDGNDFTSLGGAVPQEAVEVNIYA